MIQLKTVATTTVATAKFDINQIGGCATSSLIQQKLATQQKKIQDVSK